MMGNTEEAILCYDSALAIDPNSPSTLYNKRFALYNLKKLDEAEVCKAKLDEIDPGFVDALQNKGTRFFLPEAYDSTLNYTLPSRWYGGEENVSGNVSTNMTATPLSGDIQKSSDNLENNTSNFTQEPYDNLENNTNNYTPELNEDKENQNSGYWYVPEPDG